MGVSGGMGMLTCMRVRMLVCVAVRMGMDPCYHADVAGMDAYRKQLYERSQLMSRAQSGPRLCKVPGRSKATS
jgi:hypothetical protein